MNPKQRLRLILTITAAYAVGASLWILASDSLLGAFADAEAGIAFGTLKGFAFVAITSALLLLTLRFMPGESDRDATPPRRRSLLPEMVAAAALIVAVALVSFISYRSQLDSLRQRGLEDLHAVARLKVTGLSQWLSERRADSEAVAQNLLLRNVLQDWHDNGATRSRDDLLRTLRQAKNIHGFARITLLDGAGGIEMTTNPDRHVSLDLAAVAARVNEASKTVFVDLYREARDKKIHLAFAVPLPIEAGMHGHNRDIMLFDLRAADFIDPFLSSWPMPGRQGELILGRRNNERAVVLNAIPGRPDSALTLSIPLDQTDAPIVRYLLKGEQLIDGIDYRGAPVLAAGLSVPRTDWVLIAKLDRNLALGGIPAATIFTSVATLAGLIALIAIIAYLWQRRRLHAALAAVSQRQAAELAAVKFRDTFEQAAVGIAHIDLDGRTLQANREYCRIQGKTLEELREGHAISQNAAADQEGDLAIFDQFKRGERNTYHGERHVTRPDGSKAWIGISTSLVRDDAGQPEYLINVTMDITERKNAEVHLRQAEAVFRHTQEGIVVTDTRGMIIAVNPSFQRITGYEESELIGQNMRLLQSGQHDADFYRDMWLTIDRNGSWQGEIWNRRKSGEPYPEFLTISVVRNAAGEPINYVGTFVDITGIKESESRLVHMAHHDPLTDLPNRMLAMQRLDHAIQVARRKKRMGAVLFLDLDRFKNVNDSLGHPAGDELLLAVTRRLGRRLRESDTLARLGGDEFLVLVEDIDDSNAAAELAQILLDQFDEPFPLTGGHEVYIGTSIGISIFPDDGSQADEVVRNADAALYRAKEEGRGIYRFYTAALTDKANERLSLERRLRRAIERNEFLLHYQPLVRIKDRRIVGFEALVRWQEPGSGLIPPGKFIPLAEETGIILPLGDWVLREACRQMKIWRDAGHDLGTVAVNLSPRQFHLPDIDSIVGNILQETGLSPHFLELELTESALIEQGVGAEVRLAALRKLGARVSIDDFGTGYSSLAYLKRFPISKLKIDQSFVRDISTDPADMEITSAIIGLARNLHLDSIAEGVETEAQLAYLEEQGCEFAQGYLFSKPLPAEEIDALLRRGVLAAPALSA